MAARKASRAEQALRLVKRRGLVRPRDLAPFGIQPFHFRRLLHKGQITQVSRGVYRSIEHEPTEHHRLAEAAKVVPNGLICLLSALHFHGLIKTSPPEVWVAIGHKAHQPTTEGMPIRFVRFSGAALSEGAKEHVVEGVSVRVTTCTKTVADCFKYRNKIGLDVAIQALRECIRQNRCPKAELVKCAGLCRMTGVMRPYLEVLA